MNERRSAVIVEVPEATAAAGPWLERTSGFKPSQGVPAHITVLFPFVPAAEIDARLVRDLHALFGRHERFVVELRELRRFPTVLYLAPEPPDPFLSLTEALVSAYPEYPPYGGEFDQIVPHVTVAQGGPAALDAAETDVHGALPILAEVDELQVIAEQERDGAWDTVARIPLG